MRHLNSAHYSGLRRGCGSALLLVSLLEANASAQAWTRLDVPAGGRIHRIEASRARPGMFLATPDRGVVHSFNGGLSWERLSTLDQEYQTWAPATDPFLSAFAILPGSSNTERISSDGGLHWQFFHVGSSFSFGVDFEFDPLTLGKAYALSRDDFFGHSLGTSNNHGYAWSTNPLPSNINSPLELALIPGTRSLLLAESAQTWRTADGGAQWTSVSAVSIHPIAIDPAHPTVVWGSDSTGLQRSNNAGQNWLSIAGPALGRAVSLVASPASADELIVSMADDGVFVTFDAGASWIRSSGLPEHGVYTLERSPHDPACVVAGSQAGLGLWRSEDRGLHFKQVERVMADYLRRIFRARRQGGRIWLSGSRTLHSSSNGGAQWEMVSDWLKAGTDLREACDSPLNPQRSFAVDAANFAVLRSDDGGVHWSQPGAAFQATIRGLYVDAQERIFVNMVAQIARSVDGGATWTSAPAGYNSRSIEGSQSGGTEYLHQGSRGGYFRSTDHGASWQRITNGLGSTPFAHVAVDPRSPNKIYLLEWAGVGLYRSLDSGNSWVQIGNGLEGTSGTCLAIDPQNSARLLVALEGGGLFQSEDGGQTFQVCLGSILGAEVLDVSFPDSRRSTAWAVSSTGALYTRTF